MVDVVTGVVVALALLLAGAGAVQTARNGAVGRGLLLLAVALEVGLLVQAAVAVGRLAAGARAAETATFAGYLVFSLLVPPGGAVFALGERSRWSSAVIAVTGLVAAVLQARLTQTWYGTRA